MKEENIFHSFYFKKIFFIFFTKQMEDVAEWGPRPKHGPLVKWARAWHGPLAIANHRQYASLIRSDFIITISDNLLIVPH